MAINKKNKNRAIVDGKEYLWWVFDEVDQTEFDGIQVKAVSSDQTHFIKYGLQQEDSNRKIVLALENYTKLIHLSSPKFENKDGIITRSGIVRMVKWCKAKDHYIQYGVDKRNNKLNSEEKKHLLNILQEVIK